MVAITEDEIRELAGFRGEEALVTSCYLDVDGARHIRHQDVMRELDRVLRPARARCNGDQSVAADLARIEAHVRGGLDRSRTRGLAMFACSAQDYWRVVELPVPVRSQVVVNHTPTVRQLEAVVDQHERFGLLLVDRQRVRVFVFELGEVVESTGHFDPLPRGDDDDHSFTKDQVRDRAAALVHQHLRRAADSAFAVFQDQGFERLVIGAPDDIGPELESVLHPYLRERLVARCAIAPGATDEEVRRAALDVEADVERVKEAEAVTALREAVGGGRRGVAGLDDTLMALVERRVETLLVSAGYDELGWRCGACRWIGRIGRTCPVCASEMDGVEDVVEEAVEEALGQSCRVEICVGNADLDVMGGIGALVRY
jgi:peptide subunit release factor 1 (eRF1)